MRGAQPACLPTLSEGIALTHFIVAENVERAGRFYSDVLGGETRCVVSPRACSSDAVHEPPGT